jgi:hypothetical protein
VTPRGFVLWLLLLPGVAGAQALCGDLNLDGHVDAADAALLRAPLAGAGTLSFQQSLSCDVIHETRAPGLGPDPSSLAGACSLVDADVMTRAGQSLAPGPAQVCALGAATDCCSAHAGVGCEVPVTVSCVCAQSPGCCTVGWDAACASLACGTACAPTCDPGLSYCAGGCTNLQNDPTDCGSCATSCTNSHGTNPCAGGTCHPVCAFGWADCDSNANDGCDSLRDTNPTCLAAPSLGTLAGDAAGTITRTDFDEAWFSVQLQETVGGIFLHDLSARIQLDSPPGTNFDLFVICTSCAGAPVASSQPAGVPDVLYVARTDTAFANESVVLEIEVRFVSSTSATACGQWTLTLTGDTGIPQGTSPIVCTP